MRKFLKFSPAWLSISAVFIFGLFFATPQIPLPQAIPLAASTATKPAGPRPKKPPVPTKAAPASTATKSAPAMQATPSPTGQATATATQLSIPTLGSNISRPSATATGQGFIGGSSSEVIIATATGQPTQPSIPVTGQAGSSNCFLGGSLLFAFLGVVWAVAKALPK